MQTLAPVVDRAVEVARIDAALAAGLRGSGGFVYVEGQAGIGKTRLLELARERGGQLGARVLAARAGELEQDHGYGVVRQLFERAVAAATAQERAALLGGPAALSSRALGHGALGHGALANGAAPAAEAASPDSPLPVVHALYWLTANLAARTPLVLAVDDAHWADAPSLRFADYLAGRLDGLPVVLVVAARPVEPGGQTELLDRLRDGRGPVVVRPRPLGEQATAELLREQYGLEPSAAFVAACRRSCGGNPFYLHALAGDLRRGGVASDDAAAVVQLRGPSAIARSLALRLARLPDGAGAVVDAVAVFGRAAEVRHVAAASGLAAARVGELADLLADVDVLDAGRPLRFAHPVVRQAVYERLRPAARAALHARAAAVLADEGRAAEEVARHLLVAEPAGDPRTVALLRAVAADAVAQGAADVALTHLRRALREPPDAAARGDLLTELGRAETLVGELAAAGEHLEQAASATDDPARRAVRLKAASRAHLYGGRLERAVALLERARAGVDAETDLRLTAHAAAIGILRPPLAAEALQRLERYADSGGRTPAELAALAELAGARWLDGRIEEAAELAARALADGRLVEAEGPGAIVVNHALRVLVDADRRELALPLLDAALDAAREQATVLGIVSLLGVRSIAAWRGGDVLDAEARARELLELMPTPMSKPAHSAYLALALVERGELDEAEQAVRRSGAGGPLPPLTYVGVIPYARARLRLAQGRPDEALADLAALQAHDRQLGVGHLSVAWHRLAVEAALALGDGDGAAAFADEQLARARAWSSASGRGLALSTQGLAAGGEQGIALLREGAELLGRSPARLDHARALVDLGAALRRAGRPAQAREPLRAGLDGARGCGATALAERAHEELVVAGAKPRRLRFSGAEALTASERRVALLAAEGRSNREIAASLFVTVRTVENHLARSYRKLGIGSRRALPAALAGAAPER